MNIFQNTIVTKIYPPVTVFSEKGRRGATKNRQYYGLSFCINGQITYEQNGKRYISNTGNAVLLPKSATYKLYGDKEGLFPVINFECDCLGINTITILPLKDATAYIQDYHFLTKLFLLDNKKLKQFQLFYGILERLDSEQSKKPLSSIVNYLETHLSDSNITNEFLAKKMGISEVYLRKLFLSDFGVTPKQFILTLRIKAAQQFLTSSAETVTEISEKCGFSSVYHFCRIFKAKVGCTPSTYAKQNRIYKI